MAMFFIYDPVVGFYNDLYNKIPPNALPINDDSYNALLVAQSEGSQIAFDANTKTLIAKKIYAAPLPTVRHFSSLQFIGLFTDAEKDILMQYARNNNQAMLWLITAAGASYVDLDDPVTKKGLQYLVNLGVITQERLIEIENTGL